jgi:hypothetical protein
MYGERFKLIETFGVVEQINRKYAQYHDTSAAIVNTGEPIDRYCSVTSALTQRRHQLPNGADRWGPGIKEMDPVEEDYFNRDEEEEVHVEPLPTEEDVGVDKPFELKRRRAEDDDGEDELLQIAQRSPQAKGTHLNFCEY